MYKYFNIEIQICLTFVYIIIHIVNKCYEIHPIMVLISNETIWMHHKLMIC